MEPLSMATQTSGSPSSLSHIQAKLYRNLLTDLVRRAPTAAQELAHELTLGNVLAASRRTMCDEAGAADETDAAARSGTHTEAWGGVFSERDVIRFGGVARYEPSSAVQKHLEEELDALILSISDFFHADLDQEDQGGEERTNRARSLPAKIATQRAEMNVIQANVDAAYGRIESLVTLISEAHAQLQEALTEALSKFPDQLNSTRAASHNLLATTIETALVRLSLLRARAHRALYDHRSPTRPGANVAQALAAAHAGLKRDERRIEEEGRVLDRRLAEYEGMLWLVDGGEGGGFGQVVEDWARVQRETEECRRDLRRLGWTGD